MVVNPFLLALGEALPDLTQSLKQDRQKKRLKDVFNIAQDKELSREQKFDRMGTKLLSVNPTLGMNMIDKANAIREQKIVANRELQTKTLDQKIKLLTPLMSKATNAEQVNSIIERGGLSDIIKEFPEGTEFKTKNKSFRILNINNPMNENKPGVAFVYDDGTISFQKKKVGEGDEQQTVWLEPSPTTQKVQKVKTEADLVSDPDFKAATKSQLQNPALEGRIIYPEGSDKGFIKIETLPTKQTDAITALDDVTAGLTESMRTMQAQGLKPDPVTGRIPVVGEFINIMTKSPEWQAWASDVDRLFQKYRKITTGAQASDKEIERLIPLMPTSKDKDPEVFTRKALNVINEMQKTKDRLLNVYESQGYDVAGFGEIEPRTNEGGDKPGKPRVYDSFDAAKTDFENKLGRKLTPEEEQQLRSKFGALQ